MPIHWCFGMAVISSRSLFFVPLGQIRQTWILMFQEISRARIADYEITWALVNFKPWITVRKCSFKNKIGIFPHKNVENLSGRWENHEVVLKWAPMGTAATRNVTNNSMRCPALWLADTRQAGFLKWENRKRSHSRVYHHNAEKLTEGRPKITLLLHNWRVFHLALVATF